MRLASDFPENGVFMLMLIWALLKDKDAGSVVYQEYFEKLDYLMGRVKYSEALKSVMFEKIENLKGSHS